MVKQSRRAAITLIGGTALAGCSGMGMESKQERVADAQSTVDQATHTVGVMRASTGTRTAALLQRAKAVLIFPDMVKGGIGIGASRGQGVLLARGTAGWSEPAFYESTSVSVGLQLGVEESAIVMFILSQRAFDGLLQTSSFSLKAQAGVALADLNTATQEQLAGADVVVWSKSSGAFGGLAVSGSDIAQRPGLDRSYYGAPVMASDIIAGKATNPAAAPLLTALKG